MKKTLAYFPSAIMVLTTLFSSCKKNVETMPLKVTAPKTQPANASEYGTKGPATPESILITGTWKLKRYAQTLGYTQDTTKYNDTMNLPRNYPLYDDEYLTINGNGRYTFSSKVFHNGKNYFQAGGYKLESFPYSPFSNAGYIPNRLEFTVDDIYGGKNYDPMQPGPPNAFVSKLNKNTLIVVSIEFDVDCTGHQNISHIWIYDKIAKPDKKITDPEQREVLNSSYKSIK